MSEGTETLSPAARSLRAYARWRWWELALFAALPLSWLLLPARSLLLNEIAIVALFAVSLDLILGYAGIVSLGHAAFFGFGAYAAALFAKDAMPDPLVGLAVAVALSALLGLVTSVLILRGTDLTRLIFKSLTVGENLTAVARPGPWTPERVYAMFPRLKERKTNMGNQLSGGEQQMLAVARALSLNPRLLLLDEPLEGLAPIIVEELLGAIRDIVRGEGLGAIVVEQSARKILPITDRAIVLERGEIVHAGESAALIADPAILERLLGVAHAH